MNNPFLREIPEAFIDVESREEATSDLPLGDRVSNLRVYQDMMTQAIMTGWSPSDASMDPDPRLGSSPVGMAMDMHAAYKDAWRVESEKLAKTLPDHALDDFWNMTGRSLEAWEKDMGYTND